MKVRIYWLSDTLQVKSPASLPPNVHVLVFVSSRSASVIETVSTVWTDPSSNSLMDWAVELDEYEGVLSLASLIVIVIVSVSGVPSVA